MPTDASPPAESRNRDWHFHSDLPVRMSPLFAWPPRPAAIVRWFASCWLVLSMTVIEVALAVAVWAWLQPPTDEMRALAPGWIVQIWGRNLALMVLVAGGLHLWLYRLRRQGKRLKFDAREQARANGTFTFRDQVKDNMFWTLASGVTIWAVYEVAYFWAAANGWAPGITLAESPVWFVLWMLLLPIWSSFHFYWIHRALHWPPLYRIAHALHHRNINVGPWSGISMHPVEHLIYFTSYWIHFVVPSHPVHFLFHCYLQSLGPMASHSGFEGLVVGDRRRMRLGDFFHQLHHRYFECNYGTVEMPWDRWFGSFHDGSETATRATRERKRRMYAEG